MESSNTSRKTDDLNVICKRILNKESVLNEYYQKKLDNPDWFEENTAGYVKNQHLDEMIERSYLDEKLCYILQKIVDVIDNNLDEKIFDKLFKYPNKNIRDYFCMSLSHKMLNEMQLLRLCEPGITFECYFELAILYYRNELDPVSKLEFLFDLYKIANIHICITHYCWS